MQLENRNIVKCILLTFVTCGIYSIVWGVKIARDAVKVKDVNDDGLVEILLVLFLPFIGFFLAERKLDEGCRAAGIEHKDNSILYLVLGLFGLGIVNYCLMQSDLNKIADAGYTFAAAPAAPYTPEAPVATENVETPVQEVAFENVEPVTEETVEDVVEESAEKTEE